MYKQIYNVFLRGLTCGAEYVLLGETEDGVIYDILTNEVVDTGVEYYFYNYITNDRKLLNYKEDLIVKAVISDAPNSGIQYFVDSNNYLYGFNYDEGVTITKVSDKKVKYIYYGEKDERAYIQFTDDSFFSEHGNSKRISYVKVDK